MPCPKINAAYLNLNLSEIQIRSSWFISFFLTLFYFSSLDWSGEAGAVQKGQELLALQTKLETLTNQFSDSKQHIEVLKESLTAKEQRAAILQTSVAC